MLNRLRGDNSAPAARTRIRGIVALVSTALMLGGILAVPASAAPQKYYTPTITPTCRAANSAGNLALTLTNNMAPGGQGFGSAQIKIPTGWQVPTLTPSSFSFANPSTPRNWTGTLLNPTTIQLASGSSADLVPPGGSVTFTFPATAPGSGSSTWLTSVKQSNNFLGTGNDFTLKSGTPQPVVTIGICSAPPVAHNDAYNATEDTQLSVTAPGVLSNDTDPEGDALTAVLVAGPLHGSLTLNANGSFTYTGAANYNGTDTFTYRANDGSSNSTAAATVTITIGAVNDAPAAVADSYSTTEDTPLTVTATSGVLSNDSDPEGSALTAIKVSDPSNGVLTLGANGGFTYTPFGNFNGSDSFTYKANDGSLDSNTVTVSITVGAANDAPTAVDDGPYDAVSGQALTVTVDDGVLANDTDQDNDPLSATVVTDPTNGTLVLNIDGSFTYTSDEGYYGSDSFTYQASDGTDSDVATVNIDVWQFSVDCGQTIAVFSDRVHVTNVSTESPCPAAIITVTFDGDELEVLKPAHEHVLLRIGVDDWNKELAVSPVPATEVTPPGNHHEGQWCNGPDTEHPSMPTGENWCLIKQGSEIAGTGPIGDNPNAQLMLVNEEWLLDGDALACRTCK